MQQHTGRAKRQAAETLEDMAEATSEEEGSDPMGRVLDSMLMNKALIALMRIAMTITPFMVGLAWNAVSDVSRRLADEQMLLARYGDRISAVETKAREADDIALRANQLGAVTQGRFNDLMNRVLHIEQVVTEKNRSDNSTTSAYAPPG